ncbi:MAG: hypothetical protein HYX75_16485 [Acidobacteria bacterium]|nr:hypothetical protein [Acidobacteriota bacterium]
MSSRGGILVVVASLCAAGLAQPADPWFITSPVTVSTPMEVGDVIVASGGSLVVTGVPEPGFRVTGNLVAGGSGQIRLQGSVIRFMSRYHGQYALIAAENSSITVAGCDYRVPGAVQHGLVAIGQGVVSVRDTDFDAVQLVAAKTATLRAARLTGNFEVIIQDEAHVDLRDIPRTGGQGALWVWPEFPSGSVATYTPPLPGYIERWSFPPAGSTGIEQTCALKRCQVLLWPMLARPGCDLTLLDIPSENWVVVGFRVPSSQTIKGLQNGMSVEDEELSLTDRRVRLVRATIDTFNIYTQKKARVTVRDSTIGELLAMDQSTVLLRDVLVDGSGGYFGALDRSTIDAEDSTFTCDVQASGNATMSLHRSNLLPYPQDPTGAYTRYGAFDSARLLLDTSPVSTTAALGGRGLIAACWIAKPPKEPPAAGTVLTLRGTAVQYSLDSTVVPGLWRLEAMPVTGGPRTALGQGNGNIQNGALGTWTDADPASDYQLRTILIDALGRTLTGRLTIPRAEPLTMPSPSTVAHR